MVNCAMEHTRQALRFYLLTGQLLPAAVGSLTMFSLLPKFKGGRSRNDSCFHSISSRLLTKRTMEHNGDFVAGAVSVLRTHIQKLNRLVIGNRVSIMIEDPCIVSLSNPSVVDAIRASCPWTMSWKNCLDYMAIVEFHSLARASSAPRDRVHFGYV